MSVMPGSHRQLLAHSETYHKDNMLTRGQEIDMVTDEPEAEQQGAPASFF